MRNSPRCCATPVATRRWRWPSGFLQRFAQAAQEVENRPICATVSIGLVHCQEAALDVAELLAQADQALYTAKERGRNRVEVASLDMMLKREDERSRRRGDFDGAGRRQERGLRRITIRPGLSRSSVSWSPIAGAVGTLPTPAKFCPCIAFDARRRHSGCGISQESRDP